MSKTFKIFLILVIIGLIAGVFVWRWVNKPEPDVENAKGIKVNAVDLYNSFLNDTAFAKKTYIGQIVNVTGIIVKEDSNNQKQQIILLQTNTTGGNINCTMEKPVTDIKLNETINIQGICRGIIIDQDMGIPGDVILTRGYKK